MQKDLTRRTAIKAAIGTVAIGGIGGQLTATSTTERYLVDTRSADDDAWRSEVEVVTDLPEIDVAVVRGSESGLADLRYARDVELTFDPPKRKPASELGPDEPSVDDPAVESIAAEADVETNQHGTGGDPDVTQPHPLQWDKQAQSLATVHRTGVTGDDVVVSIVDSGIDPNHPDLAANVDPDRSENHTDDDEGAPGAHGGGHGTHVAGIVGATGDNQVVGHAPDVTLADNRVFTEEPGAALSWITSAIVNSARPVSEGGSGADVANLSLGLYPALPTVDRQVNIELYGRAVSYALDQGTLLVASAGNEDTNLSADEDVLSLPNELDGFMSISATGPVGFGQDPATAPKGQGPGTAPTHLPSVYTNYGDEAVDMSAEGGNFVNNEVGEWWLDMVYNAFPDGEYGWRAGTSMAAPQVAGMAALVVDRIRGAGAEPDPVQVRNHLVNTALSLEQPGYFPDREEFFVVGETTDRYFGLDLDPGRVMDDELEDPYANDTYRGHGHAFTLRAVTKSIPFAGGIEVRGETVYPADPDDDGRYEDVNGDGSVDMADVRLLYDIALNGAVDGDTTAFDFNGDGQFDVQDVQALLRMVE